MNIKKKIIFLQAFLGFMLFQGCDSILDSIIGPIPDDDLELTATGQQIVSDCNTYTIDSGRFSVTVSFTGFSNSVGTHYRPKVTIQYGCYELDSFSGDDEINGHHENTYSVYSTSIDICAELRQNSNPIYYDTASIKLTDISVY